MIRYKLYIVKVFIIVSLLSCEGSIYTDQVNKYPETKVANNWTLKLPFDLIETERKGYYYQKSYYCSSGSIVVGVSKHSETIEDAVEQFNYIVKNETQGEVSGPCMGSFTGYSKDYNFIDSANMLSGIITDYEENARWKVSFDVMSARTGDRLSIGFENLSYQDVKLIHEVIRSIRYYK